MTAKFLLLFMRILNCGFVIIGAFPLECVKMQHQIAREAEASIFHKRVSSIVNNVTVINGKVFSYI